MTELSLSKAIKTNQLEAFIQQEEAKGVVVDKAEFDRRLERLIKAPRPADQTSRSRARGGSRGR